MDRRCCNCYKDLLPFMVLVGNESIIIGVYTLFKAVTLQGMSKYVFVAYSYTVSTILLLPLYFFYTRTTQAKVWGSIISISGAFIVTFYKGKSIIIAQDSSSPHLQQSNHILTSVDTNWVIGGLLLTLSNILLTIWFVAQVEIMKEIEDELTLVFVHNLFATILALIVGLLAETNKSLWKLRLDISMISIICTGIFGKFLSSAVYAWAIHLKGPVYATMFKPLSIVIAVVMGIVFLGDTLHIGSLIGATIISIGFYAVMWGKAAEENEDGFGSQESATIDSVPLLQSY